MTRLLAALLMLALASPSFAQTSDIVTHVIAADPQPPLPPPPVDLSPLWLALQKLAERQATYETRLDVMSAQLAPLVGTTAVYDARIGALEMRTTVLESVPKQPPAVVQVFAGIGSFFSQPAVIAVIVTFGTCALSKKC